VIHRQRLCDACGTEIRPGERYVRTGETLCSDITDRRSGMVSTSTDILAQRERELCEACARTASTVPTLDFITLEELAKREGRL